MGKKGETKMTNTEEIVDNILSDEDRRKQKNRKDFNKLMKKRVW